MGPQHADSSRRATRRASSLLELTNAPHLVEGATVQGNAAALGPKIELVEGNNVHYQKSLLLDLPFNPFCDARGTSSRKTWISKRGDSHSGSKECGTPYLQLCLTFSCTVFKCGTWMTLYISLSSIISYDYHNVRHPNTQGEP